MTSPRSRLSPTLGLLARWWLALQLIVCLWILEEGVAEAGSWSLLLLRNLTFYALLSALVGIVLSAPLALLAALRGKWLDAKWPTLALVAALTAVILGPELILALSRGSLPTRLATPQLQQIYLASLIALGLAGAAVCNLGARLGWSRWAPGLRTLVIVWLSIALVFSGSAVMTAGDTSDVVSTDRRGPNVLLIVIDALRADSLGCYGSPLAETPHMDALSARGVRFDSCFAVATTSVPGHAGILFGEDTRVHLAMTNQHDAPDSLASLADRLRERGYRTVGICRNQLISKRAGFARGFDFYWSSGRRALSEANLTFTALQIPHVQIAGKALDTDWVSLYARVFLRSNDDRPVFLFLQFLHCHQPYRDGNRWASGANLARVREAYGDGTYENFSEYDDEEVARFHASYLGSIQYMDSIVGELMGTLESRGLIEDTLVIVTSDHGENLAEHSDTGVGEHAGYYDTSIRIPLLAAGPGLSAQTTDVLTGQDRIDDLVLRLVDRTPPTPETLLTWVAKDRHFIYSDPYAVMLDDSLKVVLDESGLAAASLDEVVAFEPTQVQPGAPLVFDWRADRNERRPLARRDARVLDLLRNVVEDYESLQARGAFETPVSLDPERLEALRALGYID